MLEPRLILDIYRWIKEPYFVSKTPFMFVLAGGYERSDSCSSKEVQLKSEQDDDLEQPRNKCLVIYLPQRRDCSQKILPCEVELLLLLVHNDAICCQVFFIHYFEVRIVCDDLRGEMASKPTAFISFWSSGTILVFMNCSNPPKNRSACALTVLTVGSSSSFSRPWIELVYQRMNSLIISWLGAEQPREVFQYSNQFSGSAVKLREGQPYSWTGRDCHFRCGLNSLQPKIYSFMM